MSRLKITQDSIYLFLEACQKHPKMKLIDLVIIENDKVLFEHTFPPYLKHQKHLLYSVTKSFTSLAIGIAVDQNLITLEDKIHKYFKDQLPANPDPHLFDIKIKHLLMMAAGNDYESPNLRNQSDWVTAFLNQRFTHEAGGYYFYSSLTSHMLSAIISKVTGLSLEVFLKRYLFEPLGIKDYTWDSAPEGLTSGGAGLSLSAEDLVKFADLLMHQGQYRGQQIVSKSYLNLATTPKIIKQEHINNPYTRFTGFEYGYQFHISPNHTYRADGAYGQFVVIDKKQRIAVVAISQATDYEYFHMLVDTHFIQTSEPKAISNGLNNLLNDMSHVEIHKNTISCPMPTQTYKLPENELKMRYISFSYNQLKILYDHQLIDYIDFDFEKPLYGYSHFLKDQHIYHQMHYIEANVTSSHQFSLKIFYLETPFIVTYTFEFKGKTLLFNFTINENGAYKGFSIKNI